MQIDLKQLQEALTDAFVDIASFRQLLADMGRNWSTFAGTETTLPQGITEVIARAKAEDWLPELLKAVEGSAAKDNPKVQAFLAAHPHLRLVSAAAHSNPLDSNFLVSNRPFVGRARLRLHLGKLGQPGESRVLLVDGARGCGKSYTNSFLQFAATRWQPCRVHYFDLDQQACTLEQLGGWLQEELSLPLPIPSRHHEQDARWVERLASWTVHNTADRPGPTWLVFDGFRLHEHERGVYDFIDRLGKMVDDTAASRCSHLRLVLINYKTRMPEDVAVGAMEERVQPPEKSDFEICFVRLLEHNGIAADMARLAFDEAYTQAETKSESDPDGRDAARLRYVNLALTRALKRLIAS